MKVYRVKVTEKHCDYVWVEAESAAEALKFAPNQSDCEYELLYDCEIVDEKEGDV